MQVKFKLILDQLKNLLLIRKNYKFEEFFKSLDNFQMLRRNNKKIVIDIKEILDPKDIQIYSDLIKKCKINKI